MFEVNPEVVKLLQDLPGTDKSYIVGGAARDIILKKKVKDYDIIVTPDDFTRIIKSFNNKKAVVFCLDKERDYYRVITSLDKSNSKNNNKLQFDLTKLENHNLIKDLSNRDFTINAVALPIKYFIKGSVSQNDFVDPYSGIDDIKDKILRPVSKEKVFKNDPVRIIRSFRFISIGFEPEEDLFYLIEKNKQRLNEISSDRLYQELFLILEDDELKQGQSSDFITLHEMSRLNLWETILPFWPALFENVKLKKELLLHLENWFCELKNFIKNIFEKDDITFIKWLIWWSLILEENRVNKFINYYNDYFPVLRKHKKCSEYFLKGLFSELKTHKLEQLLEELAEFFTNKNHLSLDSDIQDMENFFVVGQIVGDKLTDLIKVKAMKVKSISAEFNYRKSCLNKIKKQLSLIRKSIDGRFVLSYFEKTPGPWLTPFIKKVHFKLLMRLIKAPPEKNVEEMGRQIIVELKESEDFGGEYDS